MALINNKKEFVQSVGLIVETDRGMIESLFPTVNYQTKEEIVYDAATVEGVSPEYSSFSETANVVSKDGKDRVSLKPVNFNNAISKETIDADAEQFGQNEYGEGSIDATMQSALTGVGKLHLNRLVGEKKIAYEALCTHKIVGGHIGANGAEDIVFNVPSANKEVFDGTVLKYWSDTVNSTPLDDMLRAYKAMKIKPTRIIMNDTMYSYFYDNAKVFTTDNTSSGIKKNFTVNENVAEGAKFFKAGRVNYKGMIIDVYVENEVRNTGAGYTPFMPDGYVVYASPVGEMNYGGIPIAESGGVRRMATDFDVQEIITQNPPQHLVQYRSAPLPTIKNGEAYFSQFVIA